MFSEKHVMSSMTSSMKPSVRKPPILATGAQSRMTRTSKRIAKAKRDTHNADGK